MATDDSLYLEGIAPGIPIYKYIPLKYIINMYITKRIVVNSVTNWEDVYENYFLKQNLLLNGKPINTDEVCTNTYGMSWTSLKENDAMWRIYSNYGKGLGDIYDIALRVSTTPKNLYDALSRKEGGRIVHIYKVKYQQQGDIDNHLEQLAKAGEYVDREKEIRESIKTKRAEFTHEQEVRAIIGVDSCHDDINPSSLYIQFEPNDLFHNFVMDPRVTPEQEHEIKSLLVCLGIDLKKISKSQLYNMQKYNIELAPTLSVETQEN